MMAALRNSATLLAALGSIGIAGGTLLAVWVPELTRFAAVTLIVAFVLVAAAGLMSFPAIVKAISGRRGRFSGIGLATITLAVGLTVIINVITNATGVNWDLTATRQFEISSQAVTVLEALDSSVEAIVFVVPTNASHAQFQATAEQFLSEFSKRTELLTYRFVDPELQPSVARSRGAVKFPSVIFTSGVGGGRSAVSTEALSEQRLITAILLATKTQKHKVYSLAGHGERDFNDIRSDSLGYGLAARGLAADGYTVSSLNLIKEDGIPHDASALIIAAPLGETTDAERDAVIGWLANGGRAVILLEPNDKSPEITRSILTTWGIEQIPGTIVDPTRSAATDARSLVVQRDQYRSRTSITQGGAIVSPLGSTLLPGASALRPLAQVEDRINTGESVPVRYGSIAESSAESWVSPNLDSKAFDEATDERGPHTVSLVLQASGTVTKSLTEGFDPNRTQTRLVVFGDADFASNRHFEDLGNGDLFLNSVNWILEDQALIAIRAKTEVFRPLVLSANEFNLFRYIAWFLLPATMAAIGAFAWWRRR
jgi:hypothetical protein